MTTYQIYELSARAVMSYAVTVKAGGGLRKCGYHEKISPKLRIVS